MEDEYSSPVAENEIKGEPSFGLRSPVGLHVRDIESPPVAIEDEENFEYEEIWLGAMRA